MKTYMKYLLTIVSILLLSHATIAGWGIKGLYVFGDSLSDSGNAALYDEGFFGEFGEALFPVPPYYPGRASNGPVWIEIAADAYGYDASPYLDGGRNFAFIGAETGEGLSDQETPNFLEQVAMFVEARDAREIKNVHPKDLFVVWVGINDFQRILAEGGEIDEEAIDQSIANIVAGILALKDEGARLFMVPNMPAAHLTPYVIGAGLAEFFEEKETAFNEALEVALQELEADKKVTIYRLDAKGLMETIHADPEAYGLVNVTDPLIFSPPSPAEEAEETEEEEEVVTDYDYLYWDDFHPTVEGHALFAQFAMEIIPIGSWWGRSVARGPDGTAFLGMGWVDDSHWPWIYSYSLNEGEWMWVFDEAGDLEGFIGFIPEGYKWVWVNAMSGWYYDYSTGAWVPVEEPEEEEETPEET